MNNSTKHDLAKAKNIKRNAWVLGLRSYPRKESISSKPLPYMHCIPYHMLRVTASRFHIYPRSLFPPNPTLAPPINIQSIITLFLIQTTSYS